jgi:hypothetical protein
LSYYIAEFKDANKKALETYQKEIDKIDRKWCSVDADRNFYLDVKGNPIYTKISKENVVFRDADVEKLLEKKIEVTSVDCVDLSRISTLHISFIKLFNGFLFNVTEEWIIDLFTTKEPKEQGSQPAKT